jgi:hypothetical protein
MDKTWRPEEWNNPYLQQDDAGNYINSRLYEAGADAMLEALRKEGYIKFDKLCPYCGASTRLECGFCSANRYPIDIPDDDTPTVSKE